METVTEKVPEAVLAEVNDPATEGNENEVPIIVAGDIVTETGTAEQLPVKLPKPIVRVVTVLPLTVKEIGLPCDVVPVQFPAKPEFTVSAMVVLALSAPLVPFTANEYDPGATPDPTLIVTTELLVAGLVPNVPVIPAGQPEAASVTPELKPFAGVIVTVEVPVPPAFAAVGVALSVKLGEPPPDKVNVPSCCQGPEA